MFNLLHVVLPPSSLPSIGFQGVFFFFFLPLIQAFPFPLLQTLDSNWDVQTKKLK